MATNSKLAVAYRNLALDTVLAQANGGFVDVYDGIQPTDADTAIIGQNLLVRLPMGSPAQRRLLRTPHVGSGRARRHVGLVLDSSAGDARRRLDHDVPRPVAVADPARRGERVSIIIGRLPVPIDDEAYVRASFCSHPCAIDIRRTGDVMTWHVDDPSVSSEERPAAGKVIGEWLGAVARSHAPRAWTGYRKDP